MNTYTPDSWIVVKLTPKNKEPFYKILASWYGGFAGDDYWKLSSGCESLTILEDGSLHVPQVSGSVYVLHGSDHPSSLIMSMLSSFIEQAAELDCVLERVSIEELERVLLKQDFGDE